MIYCDLYYYHQHTDKLLFHHLCYDWEKKFGIISSLLTKGNPIPLFFINIILSVSESTIFVVFSSYFWVAFSFHLSDDIYELFFMDSRFRECLWYQFKWHGSTFECISSMTSLRSQVVTLSELRDRKINELKWSTGYRERLSSYIVWDIQAFATSTMIKRGKSFLAESDHDSDQNNCREEVLRSTDHHTDSWYCQCLDL